LIESGVDLRVHDLELVLKSVPLVFMQKIILDALLELDKADLVGFLGQALIETPYHLTHLRVLILVPALLGDHNFDQWVDPLFL